MDLNSDKKGSNAYNLKNLIRIGRKFGIFFIITSQRPSSEDIPSSIKASLSNQLLFKVNNHIDSTIVNLPHAIDIKSNEIGRCAYEEGFLNFPFINDKNLIDLMNSFYKPLNSKTLIEFKKDLFFK